MLLREEHKEVSTVMITLTGPKRDYPIMAQHTWGRYGAKIRGTELVQVFLGDGLVRRSMQRI